MRVVPTVAIAAALFATPVMAADSNAPLAPGKPAGLTKAQDRDNTILYIIGGGAVIAGIALLASSSNGGNGNSSNPGGGGSGTSGSSP